MITRKKKKFTYPERYAVWHCNDRRCWLCLEPLRLVEVTVDHVLPESLLDDEVRLHELLEEYELPRDFNINGYENWLPCHNHCNLRKGSRPLQFIPGNKLIFDRLSKQAHLVKRTELSVSSNAAKDQVYSAVFAALERQTITVHDLNELLTAFVEDPTKAGVPEDVIILDSGYWVRRDDIVREGICCCERNSCVGHNTKVYCYFESSLPPWVIKTGLFWKCYDEIINCPRCSRQHKRGHIGRESICGRPYLNQEAQSD